MYRPDEDTIEPTKPYLVQRLTLGHSTRSKIPDNPNHPRIVRKIDYRKVKCVHGGIPSHYEKAAVNEPEKMREVRKEIYSFDYMGSAEFEFGALPYANWKFLRAFERGDGIIKRIEIRDSKTGQSEKFWVFAPKNTLRIAIALIRLVSYHAIYWGHARISLKEGLGFDSALFPQSKGLDGFDRHSYRIEDRTKNELDLIGWFDLDNCFNIIWDRGDIAQAFSNLHGFGNVLNLETEIYDVRDGFSGQPPESREYFKAVLGQVDE